MTRKRCSHCLHLLPPKQVKYHLNTCRKRRRCKDPDEKCEKDLSTCGEEEFGFESLNLDVMELVFSRLNDPVTRIRFSAVCRFWRWVARHCSTPQFPWLKLQHDCESDYIFFNLSDGMTHTFHVPGPKGLVCSGSFEGWLVMQTPFRFRKKEIFLVDPLSKVKIHLPVTTINDSDNRQTVLLPPMFVFYLSSAPISIDGAINNNCLVAAIDVMSNDLYLCRLGDQSWTRQYFTNVKHFNFEEIIFCDGLIIAIDSWAMKRVKILELVLESDHHLRLKAKRHFLPLPLFGVYDDDRDPTCCSNPFKWREELYLVFHEFRIVSGKFKTVAFHVFKLDSRWKLLKVKNIEDGVIFLVTDVPKCFSVRDFPPSLNLKRNCIYYKVPGSSAIDIFCLEDGKWEPCPSLSSHQRGRYVWYTPKIFY
ncbi:F-box protein SKIP23-like protein [Cinnamomum micranthum f. kanehirae]|uniref:F-box protein SKIP23-like protein n=1 Tax=Cinnamomum micranthum f. kanehirae TaxID=337451 RepID=A0A3S3M8U9_9MAGN|nr:F-box protein SKIP23-like protein [Cinnamomum micranthum f. kanehirae]